jgi:hypothetical protein
VIFGCLAARRVPAQKLKGSRSNRHFRRLATCMVRYGRLPRSKRLKRLE